MKVAQVRFLLFDALIILVAGILGGFLLNEISPWGVDLARDHFPGVENGDVAPTPLDEHSDAEERDAVERKIAERGLIAIDFEEAVALFQSREYADGRVIFVDARVASEYSAAHIPGAYLLDRFRLTQYIDEVLPVCLAADIVVVYCTGGRCEDSIFAAEDLRDLGVGPDRLRIYPGGMDEWHKEEMPIESGARVGGVGPV